MPYKPGSADSGSDCQHGVPAKREGNNHIKLAGYSMKTVSLAVSWPMSETVNVTLGTKELKDAKKMDSNNPI